ncbi:hypothetical protein M427DRAFT_56780 [Gonapodya prolifera JEL478]|uniref:Uncharacterized protein n=1 Tax=Gonapodya prolifera (strain JEL478) TaxID=1344416 RepID=A0A139AF33_GONPJ|nr:hypothetical protein M427DRAFT_56780 [Gonapodya prolifera JEL478]|eukprot:KXS15432.1 hypothetical protein M427DRAFT_56780 [Gonapodya prolifera JEL478]
MSQLPTSSRDVPATPPPLDAAGNLPAVRFRTPSDTTLLDPTARWSDSTINLPEQPPTILQAPLPPPILVNSSRNSISVSLMSGGTSGDGSSNQNNVVACLPDVAALVGQMDPYVHGALAVAVETLVQDGDTLTVLVLMKGGGSDGGAPKSSSGRRLSSGSVGGVDRDERQSLNYVREILDKFRRWYRKECTFSVRPLRVGRDPVTTILKACDSLQPTMFIIPRHQIGGTLWSILQPDLPAVLFDRATFPVMALKKHLPLNFNPTSPPSSPPTSPTSSVGSRPASTGAVGSPEFLPLARYDTTNTMSSVGSVGRPALSFRSRSISNGGSSDLKSMMEYEAGVT